MTTTSNRISPTTIIDQLFGWIVVVGFFAAIIWAAVAYGPVLLALLVVFALLAAWTANPLLTLAILILILL